MEYDVYLSYGTEGTVDPTIRNVDEVMITEDTYFFYDSEGEILFAAPREKVVYIKKK